MKSRFFILIIFFFFVFSYNSTLYGQWSCNTLWCPDSCQVPDCYNALKKAEENFDNPDPNGRIKAIERLGKIEGYGRIPILIRLLEKEPTSRVKEKIKDTLVRAEEYVLSKGADAEKKESMDRLISSPYKKEDAEKMIGLSFLRDKEENVRIYAGTKLYQLGEKGKKEEEDISSIIDVFKRASKEDISEKIRKGSLEAIKLLE